MEDGGVVVKVVVIVVIVVGVKYGLNWSRWEPWKQGTYISS